MKNLIINPDVSVDKERNEVNDKIDHALKKIKAGNKSEYVLRPDYINYFKFFMKKNIIILGSTGSIGKSSLSSIYNNKNYKKLKQIGSFDDMEESYEGSMNVKLPGGITLSQFLDMWIERTYDKLDDLFIKESEKKIADAVLTIFKTRYDLDIFKKKALYIYIREMTDCETPHLTRVISILKDDFYEIYHRYHEKGKIVIKEQ